MLSIPSESFFGKILPRSVGTKIILFVCITTFLTSLLIGGFFFNETAKNATHIQVNELASESKLLSPLFLAAFKELHNDVLLLSRVPPIKGLIRSTRNNDIDPIDGSTTELWRTRLETIFTSMLSAKPSYTQIRYIGVADGGRELIRIDRKNGEAIATPKNQLQQKEGEFYFQDVLTMTFQDIYYSTVSLNREHGKIQKPFLPVIRTIIPVYDNNNDIFGMIVINAAYENILKDTIQELDTNKNLYVINESGDLISYDPERKNAAFQFRGLDKDAPQNSIVRSIFDSAGDENTIDATIEGEDHIVYFNHLYFNPSNRDQFLITAVSVPKKLFLVPIKQAKRKTFVLTIILICLVFVCSALFSSRLTNPLRQMTKEIRNYSEEEKKIKLPVESRDEIGELARAFKDLIEKQQQANDELEEFAYRTSHDLRSPLVSSISLLGISEQALQNGEQAKAMQSLEHVQNSLKKLEILVKDILSLTRAKNQREAPQQIDVNILVEEALEKLKYMDNFERLHIEKDLNFHPSLFSKKSRIILIIENLVSNAIKYQDLEKEKSYIKISTNEKDNHFIFSVEDNGIGIPEEQQNKLFTMFSRFHPKTSFGSGLGLYMLKKSVDSLKGNIFYEPLAQGSRFNLDIPI